MKYHVEFKFLNDDYLGNWHIWHNIGCHDSPELVLIKIIETCEYQSFLKIDKNLYKFINFNGCTDHLRIQPNYGYFDYGCFDVDWIPIGEEITIEKLNNPINWNLGLLK